MHEEIQFVTALPKLPQRLNDTHKGTFGRAFIVAGSLGLTGAAILTGKAALRSGSGLVTIATPTDCQSIVANGDPCYMTVLLGNLEEDGAALDQLIQFGLKATAIAIGPGIGKNSIPRQIFPQLLEHWANIPIVIDADALNALSPWQLKPELGLPNRVLTPHPQEFARLCGKSVETIQANRQAIAVEFARQWNVVLVLKGHQTIVSDGQRVYVNTTGNPGMATGGTGDVLTGIIVGLLAQGLLPLDAAVLGIYKHGLAGDFAADKLGQVSMIASDLLDYLPKAFLNDPQKLEERLS